jgi:hypothetical protein
MKLDGSKVRRLTENGDWDTYASLSRILCTRTKDGDVAIFIIDVTKLDLGN